MAVNNSCTVEDHFRCVLCTVVHFFPGSAVCHRARVKFLPFPTICPWRAWCRYRSDRPSYVYSEGWIADRRLSGRARSIIITTQRHTVITKLRHYTGTYCRRHRCYAATVTCIGVDVHSRRNLTKPLRTDTRGITLPTGYLHCANS